MTPANPDALADALAQAIHQSLHPGGNYEMARAGQSPGWMASDSLAKELIAGPLAPLLAAHQQVTAERDEARKENDRFRAGLANGSGPCAYCSLSREDWTKCQSGFPGCDRADDAMLCPHFGAEMEANDRANAATSELARLRAEGEAKDRALRMFVRIADVWPLLTPEQADDRIENAADAARTALARAATQENSNG